MTTQIDRQNDSQIDKVVKLIPAEIAGALLAINGLVPDTAPEWVILSFAALLFLLTYFYLTKIRMMTDIYQVAFVCLIAYPLWATNIIAFRFDLLFSHAYVISCLLIVASLVPPLIFRD
ncbi:hypothetical protein H2509_12615 [Stappia sp. F7233]|uniref:Uncharacterized protein n=1 Tax=Stappia albiluteola TaxID=2758565 RepID=A0A839AFU4_9HYPH|nr:hypothetical protein [Stappia albiluteola]MBA5777966.1 hypothetical protein [Stappia albiluteola]